MIVNFDSPLLAEDLTNKTIQFVNALCLKGDQLVEDHIWVRNGKIINAHDIFYEEKKEADIKVDCHNHILSPGFIDIQINGGFGIDFSTIPESDQDYSKGIETVSKKLLAYGVTSFAPTIITSSPETYKRVLPLLAARNGSKRGAGVLGAHLEGPFISNEKKGCHPPQFVTDFGSHPGEKLRSTYGSFENIAIVTLAPELDGSDEAIRTLVEAKVVVSLGHSMAALQHGEAGVKAGATCVTHLFNAMQSYHHRDPGLIGLLTTTETSSVFFGIISDGIHTHDSALRIANQTCPSGLVLVTDAIAALGMENGTHMLGAQTIVVEGLHACLEGTNITAGSVASMPYCIRHFIHAAQTSTEEALLAATKKPANVLKLPTKGTLEIGMDADIVLLNTQIEVQATFIGGQLVYCPHLPML